MRCGGFVCIDPVTHASAFPYRRSLDEGLGRCTGMFCVDADISPCDSEDATPGSARGCVCGCVHALPGVAAGRTLVHPNGGCFIAVRGWTPHRARTAPSERCFVAGRGWVPCRARARPSGRGLFRTRQGLGSLQDTHTSIPTAAGWLWVAAGTGGQASWARFGAPHRS